MAAAAANAFDICSTGQFTGRVGCHFFLISGKASKIFCRARPNDGSRILTVSGLAPARACDCPLRSVIYGQNIVSVYGHARLSKTTCSERQFSTALSFAAEFPCADPAVIF